MNLAKKFAEIIGVIDRYVRSASPKCPQCCRPDCGFVPWGRSPWEVGIVDRARCPSPTCPMRKQAAE